MKKKSLLVTGANGFVGSALLPILDETQEFEIHSFLGDIRDLANVEQNITRTNPDVVIHLAAQAFVPRAIENPWETEEINVRGTLNLLESLHRNKKSCKLLYVSSADVYGKQQSLPLQESVLPNPINPYAGSKLAAESYCRQYSFFSPFVSVVIARPFNHIGRGQRPEFVIPNFCLQILEAKKNNSSTIMVGDLSPTRDFSHVLDIVQGYLCLVRKGEPGEIYNICSGTEVSIETMLAKLIKISNSNLKIQTDQNRFRSAETSRVYGDNSKLRSLGWSQKYSLDETLQEIYFHLAKNFV